MVQTRSQTRKYSASIRSRSTGWSASVKRHTTRASHNKDEATRDGGTHSTLSVDRFEIDLPKPHKDRHDEGKFQIFNAYSGLKTSLTTGQIGFSPQFSVDINAATVNPTLIPPMFTLESMLDIRQSAAAANSWTANTMFASRGAVALSATMFEIDQNTNMDGSSVIPLFTGPELDNQGYQRVMHLKKIEDTVMLTNFSNVGCRIKVVWFLCKNNCSKLPVELMDESVTNRRPPHTTIQTFQRGGNIIYPQPGFGFTGFVGSLGTNCLDMRNFPLLSRYWKPIKVKHFVLESGDNHEMIYTVNVKKYVQKESLVQAYTPSGSLSAGAIDNLYYRGLTVIPTVFIVPNNVYEETNAQTTMSKVTTGPFSIGSTTYRKYEFGFVNKKVNTEMQYLNNNLAVTAASATTRLFDVEDEDVAVDVTLP